jgi:hypothetical protein
MHEIGRIGGGRKFHTGGNVFQIGGNKFYNPKNEILMKIPELKMSGIGINAEFRGILTGFPNQGRNMTSFLVLNHARVRYCNGL